MFENIGGKIKVLAKIVCWIGIILACVLGIYLMNEGSGGVGFLVMVVGSFFSWIGSFILVGYGELIEATCDTRDMTYELLHSKTNSNDTSNGKTAPNANANAVPAGGWRCTCGRGNASYVSTCICGLTKHEVTQKKTETNKVHAEIKDGEKVCPKCGTAQKTDRTVCWSCGAQFVN